MWKSGQLAALIQQLIRHVDRRSNGPPRSQAAADDSFRRNRWEPGHRNANPGSTPDSSCARTRSEYAVVTQQNAPP